MVARRSEQQAAVRGMLSGDLGQRARRPCLTRYELNEFRSMLLDKRQALLNDIVLIGDESTRSRGAEADPMDASVEGLSQEVSFSLLQRQWVLLEQIDAALERIERGTYGICLGTGKPIHKGRLRACPWAKYSIGYASMVEQRGSAIEEDSAAVHRDLTKHRATDVGVPRHRGTSMTVSRGSRIAKGLFGKMPAQAHLVASAKRES